MKNIKMKAKPGVTLVELLVVILIVTILSVSMLPLLQPFVVEAQYAAEPIPVIGNIRTKVGLYQYDKGKLPCISDNNVDATTKADLGTVQNPTIESWIPVATAGSTTAGDASKVDNYTAAKCVFSSAKPPASWTGIATTSNEKAKHIEMACDIDYQDLKGKRSKPHHYQYLVMRNGSDYAYFVGCFGDGNGLKLGTGYATCEIVSTSTGHKYVGTWKRYKPIPDATTKKDVQICFSSQGNTTDPKKSTCCFVPTKDAIEKAKENTTTGKLDIISDMESYGWEF